MSRQAIEFEQAMFVMSMAVKAHAISREGCELCHSCFLCVISDSSLSSSVCQERLQCCSAVVWVVKFLSAMTVVAVSETSGGQEI